MILRDYQERYITELRNSFVKGNKKVVLCAPTGAGKTIMFSYMTRNSFTKGNKVLILTDRKELFSQSDSVLTKLGMNPQLIKPSENVDFNESLFVGMIQTIMRRIDLLKETKGVEAPYLVEHDFVLDTFEVTLLHKSYDLNFVMGELA